ncbi:response regulator [Geovibrio thiophilus]|uniref:Response regulator n=1 Tax=Geovibrio thiophilus TaxID=139438 RepID=A0A410K0N4_9BACT|nr:HD domain-containing phosphohydrolase [Geovibrio thiophilus]QAR33964.1 response regulator [Geovibrio thiophilus]
MDFFFNIIAVDDNKVNLMLIEHLAGAIGHRVKSFSNPVDALEYVQTNEIDVALVDYMMPKMNGIELTKMIKAIQPDVPIIMITAVNDDNTVKIGAFESGATEFLTKPIDTTEFKARLNNILTIRKYRKMLSERALHLQSEVEKATEVIRAREFEALALLGRVAEYRDEETGEHILRVGNYARIIAEGMGCTPEFCEQIFHTAPLHDIGKIAVSDTILNKQGKLTPEEFQIMKKHTVFGCDILKNADSPYIRGGAAIAGCHHEKYDGSGYPEGLKEEDIPLDARIVALADVFDALTSKRPYKEAWPFEQAVEYILGERGKHFDPKAVDAFMEGIDRVVEVYNNHKHV